MVHHCSSMKRLSLWRSRKVDRYYKSILDECDEIVVQEMLHDHRTCLRLPSSEQPRSSTWKDACEPLSVSSLGGESESVLFFLSGEDDGTFMAKSQRPSRKKSASVSTASESRSAVSETTDHDTEKQENDNDTLKTDDVSVVVRMSTESAVRDVNSYGWSSTATSKPPTLHPPSQTKEMEIIASSPSIYWSDDFQKILQTIHSLPKQMEHLQDEFEILTRLYYLVEI